MLASAGIQSFVVGSGGKTHYGFATGPVLASDGTLAETARDSSTFGVIRLVLHNGSFDWSMRPVVGTAFANTDTRTMGSFSGSGTCH